MTSDKIGAARRAPAQGTPARTAAAALRRHPRRRWPQTVHPRDRVLALIPFYAGLRLGEVVALNLDDIRLSARKGLIVVRMGKGGGYREIPVHPQLRPDLALWINDERPGWKGAADTPGESPDTGLPDTGLPGASGITRCRTS